MVAAVAMVRDEVDVVGFTLANMLEQVDAVIVADNGSVDGTRELLDELAGDDERLTVIDDDEPAYYQSRKMSELAARARDAGADWVVPFDADEVWYSPHGRVGDLLTEHGGYGALVATAKLFDHVATADDPTVENPLERLGWRRREALPLAKVAARTSSPVIIEQGNHGARYPADVVDGLLIVRHFPYRSPEQFVSKVKNGAAAYAATDLPDHVGAHWRQYGAILENAGPEALGDVFREYFWIRAPVSSSLVLYDPAPLAVAA